MKTISIYCLCLLMTGVVFSCTPEVLTETNDVPIVLSTGDDQSIRTDNVKD